MNSGIERVAEKEIIEQGKEELTMSLDGLYATITILVQQLSSIVQGSNFDIQYSPWEHGIRNKLVFFAGIRPNKREEYKDRQIEKRKGSDLCFETILERVKRKRNENVARELTTCIWYDKQLFE